MNTGLDSLKTASEKVVHEAGEFIRNKTADAVTKSNDNNREKQELVEEIIIPLEKNRWNVKQILKSIIKMESYKISNLSKDSNVSQFATKIWVEVNDLSSGQYSNGKSIRFKTSMLWSDLSDYSYAYIVAKGEISVTGTNGASRRNKKLIFKNSSSFRLCISKITFIDNAEDLDIAMSMYNFLEYSEYYSMKSGSLGNYYRDEVNDSANETDNNDNIKNNNKTTTSKSFMYETKIIERTANNKSRLNSEVVVPLKYLSKFWRPLDLPVK